MMFMAGVSTTFTPIFFKIGLNGLEFGFNFELFTENVPGLEIGGGGTCLGMEIMFEFFFQKNEVKSN